MVGHFSFFILKGHHTNWIMNCVALSGRIGLIWQIMSLQNRLTFTCYMLQQKKIWTEEFRFFSIFEFKHLCKFTQEILIRPRHYLLNSSNGTAWYSGQKSHETVPLRLKTYVMLPFGMILSFLQRRGFQTLIQFPKSSTILFKVIYWKRMSSAN